MTFSSQPTGPDQDLSRQFQQAAERVSNLDPDQVNPQMHTLYGLYKQATEGDHDTFRGEVGREEHDNPDGPAGLSQAQWDAWSQCKGLSREAAMRRYVEEAGKLTGADQPTGSGKGDGSEPNFSQAQPSGEKPTRQPRAGEPTGTEAGAANAGLKGDLRAGAPYGSEEERKEDDEAQTPTEHSQQAPR